MNQMPTHCARPFWSGRIPLALVGIFVLCSISAGQQAETADNQTSPTANARRTTPWFDAENNSLKPIDIKPQTDDTLNRNSRWLPKPKPVKSSNKAAPKKNNTTNNQTTTGTRPTTGNGLFNSGLTIMNLLGWITLGLVVLAGVGAIFYVLSQADLRSNELTKRRGRVISGKTPDEQTLERMKHLPEELRRTDVNLRSESLRLMQAGEYDQAIILLFAHQLLLLDRIGALRLSRGKTNRRYIRETRATNEHAASCLEAVVESFERSYFGRHKITRTEFADMWRSNEQLEAGLEQSQGEAA